MGSKNVYTSRREHKEIYEALITWIRDLKEWDLFATLTIRNQQSGNVPNMQDSWKIAEGFSRRMESYGAGVYLVEEKGSVRDRLHWHALIQSPKGKWLQFKDDHPYLDITKRKWVDQVWKMHRMAGFTKVSAIENKTAVTRYVAKYTVKDLENRWIMS